MPEFRDFANMPRLLQLTRAKEETYSCREYCNGKFGEGVHVSRKEPKEEVLGLLGVALDGDDGHKRITRCEEFLLVGGSEETHEGMQDVALRFTDSLRQRGRPLRETPVEEVIELLHKATGK